MSVISMKQLLEAGVHFGHQTRRWNPKMAEYIYTERNGIYIIDLQKSVGKVDEAYKAVLDCAANGEKLEKNLGGIKDMKDIPDMIFIVDPRKERNCVHEAHTLGIPLVGIADTNCDPEELDYVIPGNDDAIRAVKLIVSKMADAVIEANQGADVESAEEAESAEADAAEE